MQINFTPISFNKTLMTRITLIFTDWSFFYREERSKTSFTEKAIAIIINFFLRETPYSPFLFVKKYLS